MNQAELIKCFYEGLNEGKCSGGGNLYIKGDKLFHYCTVLLERYNSSFIVNMTRYSIVTGTVQKKIKEIIPEEKLITVTKVDVDFSGSLSEFIKEK